MAKLSSLKIKMGQMQYEKERKEHKLQAAKVGFSHDAFPACCMIMVFDLSLQPNFCFGLFFVFVFLKRKISLECDLQVAVSFVGMFFFFFF